MHGSTSDASIKPMLARRVSEIPAGNSYIFEPKWDGFRALIFRDGSEVLIQSRDEKSLNRYFPELLEPLTKSLPNQCVLDGEIVIVQNDGLDFDAPATSHSSCGFSSQIAFSTNSGFHRVFSTFSAKAAKICEQHRLTPGAKIMEDTFSSLSPPLHLTPSTKRFKDRSGMVSALRRCWPRWCHGQTQ
jgi:hypothetical protein